jgi:hypothetical protein
MLRRAAAWGEVRMFELNMRELVSQYMPHAVADPSKVDAGAVVEVTWTLFSNLRPFYVSADIEAQANFFAALLPEVEAHIDGR